MKKILLIALLAILPSTPAFADGGYGHGGGHGGGGGGWWIIPALIGGAMVYELSRPQPPDTPYPTPVYVEPPQQVYVPSNQPVYAPEVASSPVRNWYFCAAANGYYPYVRSCPNGWQTIPTAPPAPLPSSPYAPPPPPR